MTRYEPLKIKPCPRCGADVEQHRMDSIYPTNREHNHWNIICKVHNGGCDYEIDGPDKEELIHRWNNVSQLLQA